MGMNDKDWMLKAYEQALLAKAEGEVPVGAVLVSSKGLLLAAARNAIEHSHDPCDHAEVRVIRQAAQTLKNHRLLDTTLYVTLEPCAMCAGLIVHARIKRVVFAARDFKAGAGGSVLQLFQGAPLNHKVIVDEGIMAEECAALLTHFFESKR
jgi:tRNA(adenine34) deaminase